MIYKISPVKEQIEQLSDILLEMFPKDYEFKHTLYRDFKNKLKDEFIYVEAIPSTEGWVFTCEEGFIDEIVKIIDLTSSLTLIPLQILIKNILDEYRTNTRI